MQSDEATLRELHAAWIDAVNAGDLEALLGYMTADALFIGPGEPPFGADGFRSRFAQGHRQFRLNCTSDLQELAVAGAIAYTVCRDRVSLVPRDGGAPTQLEGHRMTIYRRQADGAWRLARDAHTLAAAAA